MTPGATMVPVTKALPPITGPGPRIGISRSAASMPFCNGTTAVCRPDDWADLFSGGLDVPQLDAEQDVINDADAGDIVGSLSGPDVGLAAIPLDAQTVLANCRKMGAARNKGDVRPGLGERGAIGPADAAGADHGDAHPILSFRP